MINVELKHSIEVNDNSISNEFYIELSNKLEEMYNKSKTFGEVTLMGDLIGLLNSKIKTNTKERSGINKNS